MYCFFNKDGKIVVRKSHKEKPNFLKKLPQSNLTCLWVGGSKLSLREGGERKGRFLVLLIGAGSQGMDGRLTPPSLKGHCRGLRRYQSRKHTVSLILKLSGIVVEF